MFDQSLVPNLPEPVPWREIFARIVDLHYHMTVDVMPPPNIQFGEKTIADLRQAIEGMERVSVVVHLRPLHIGFVGEVDSEQEDYLTNHIASLID